MFWSVNESHSLPSTRNLCLSCHCWEGPVVLLVDPIRFGHFKALRIIKYISESENLQVFNLSRYKITMQKPSKSGMNQWSLETFSSLDHWKTSEIRMELYTSREESHRAIFHEWLQLYIDSIYKLTMKPSKWNVNTGKPCVNDVVLFTLNDSGYGKDKIMWKLGKSNRSCWEKGDNLICWKLHRLKTPQDTRPAAKSKRCSPPRTSTSTTTFTFRMLFLINNLMRGRGIMVSLGRWVW